MTTTKPKVAKPPRKRAAPLRKSKRSSYLRDLAAEMKAITGKDWDPGYLSNLVTGIKVNKRLNESGHLTQAVSNLTARAANTTGEKQ